MAIKNKKVPVRKSITRRTAASKRGTLKVLQATSLGIAAEHILAPRLGAGPGVVAVPAAVQYVEEFGNAVSDAESSLRQRLHRPLVSLRTSFWLGVGFGILVTGVLGYIAWKLYNVEIAEAIVLSLGV